MKNDSVILIISLLLVLLQGCGGDGSGLKYEAPQHVTTKTPFEVEPPEEEQTQVNPYDLNKDDPCYSYLQHEVVVPVATCTKLESGRIKDAFKATVRSGKLCLLRKSFPNGVNLFTLIGDVQETKKDGPLRNHRIDVFGQSNLDEDLLKFEMKADAATYVKYNLRENTVTVRQLSKVWKKRLRYFRFSCQPISDISN